MNKTISLAAIALVAVVMGMSTIAPDAMAVKNADHNPKVAICHFDYNLGVWEADKMVNKHALEAHQAHGDQLVPSEISVVDCLAQTPLPPKVI